MLLAIASIYIAWGTMMAAAGDRWIENLYGEDEWGYNNRLKLKLVFFVFAPPIITIGGVCMLVNEIVSTVRRTLG